MHLVRSLVDISLVEHVRRRIIGRSVDAVLQAACLAASGVRQELENPPHVLRLLQRISHHLQPTESVPAGLFISKPVPLNAKRAEAPFSDVRFMSDL